MDLCNPYEWPKINGFAWDEININKPYKHSDIDSYIQPGPSSHIQPAPQPIPPGLLFVHLRHCQGSLSLRIQMIGIEARLVFANGGLGRDVGVILVVTSQHPGKGG